MKKKFLGGIAILTVALTFVFAMNLNAQVEEESSLLKETVEQICCNKAFQNKTCVTINQTAVKGLRHQCD